MARIYTESERMSLRATYGRILGNLTNYKDFAAFLTQTQTYYPFPFRPNQIKFFVETENIQRRIRQFHLRKKHGGFRDIVAPHSSLEYILKQLNIIFQVYYEPKSFVCGFVRGKSLVDNARPHVGHSFILSMDLKNFFPSINRDRIREMFRLKPFEFSAFAAEAISGLCTAHTVPGEQDTLPQGFPTSPILANMICAEMDDELALLARMHNVTFTRYADDLTFSCNEDILRPTGEFANEVRAIIEKHHFVLNDKKTHLQRNGKRKEVTGIIVDKKVNLSRQYIREIRNILYIWKRYGYKEACKAVYPHYRKQHGTTKGQHHYVNLNCVMRGKLNYLKMVRGEDDAIYQKFQSTFSELAKRDYEKVLNDTPNYLNNKETDNDFMNSCSGRILYIIIVVILSFAFAILCKS